MDPVALRDQVRAFAAELPEAVEAHPWEDDRVVKVRGKIFVFLGADGGEPGAITVKLPGSQELALAMPGVTPAGYGLGRSGWVSVSLRGETLPLGVLLDWVEESYRAVAPKRLVAELDQPD